MANDLRGTVLVLDTPAAGFVTNGIDSTRGQLNSDVFYNQIIWSGYNANTDLATLTDALGTPFFQFNGNSDLTPVMLNLGSANQRAVGGIKMPTLTSGVIRIYQI